jgi:hypothetical protein
VKRNLNECQPNTNVKKGSVMDEIFKKMSPQWMSVELERIAVSRI